MKKEIEEWFRFADQDIAVAKTLPLNNDEMFAESITFHCQQSIEKCFKAYLIENGWELEKTHNLEYLCAETRKIKDLQIDKELLLKLDKSYLGTRYPRNYIKLTKQDVKDFINLAETIQKAIKQELGIESESKTETPSETEKDKTKEIKKEEAKDSKPEIEI